MGTNQTDTPLLIKLKSLRRGADLIRRTRDIEGRRAMLAEFLRDVRSLDRLLGRTDLSEEETTLLHELLNTAEELPRSLRRVRTAGKKHRPAPARRENRTNGTSIGRATSTIRTAHRLESREPGHRRSSASGLPRVRTQDPESDPSRDSGRGLRRDARQVREELASKQAAPSPEEALHLVEHGEFSKEPPESRWIKDLVSEDRPLSAAEWRQLGFYRTAANYLARSGTSPRDLARMSRKDFLSIQGLGPHSLKVCERLLGRALPPAQPDARVAFWESKGIPRASARTLARAGITSPGDLLGKGREDLEAIHRIGDVVIARLEEIQGKPFPVRSQYWIDLGLPWRLAGRLVRAGIYTVADFKALTREGFLAIAHMGPPSLELIEKAVGYTLSSTLACWTSRGLSQALSRKLVAAEITTLRQLKRKSSSELRLLGLTIFEIEKCQRLIRKK